MSRYARGWWSWRGRSRASGIGGCMCCCDETESERTTNGANGVTARPGRARGVVAVAVSSYRYQTRGWDEPLRTRLLELARQKPRFGYRRLHVLLRGNGGRVNHKRVHRVYREAGLSLRRKKRKHCVRVG